jgi:hypothetical protein
MATTPRALKGMVAVSIDSDVTPLGYITWLSIPDESTKLGRLKRALGVHGLPTELAPRDTKAIHTFKRAMREQEGRHRENGHIRETTVAVVKEDGRECIYQVTSLKRDLEDNIIEYSKSVRATFTKATDEMGFSPLAGAKRSEVAEIVFAIQEWYEANTTSVTGARVRGIVRNYLRNQPDDERGKAGGVYFIPAKFRDELDALAEMLEELYKGKAYLHYVPMADGASERDIIRRHHIANTRSEMAEAITATKALISADRERAVRSDVIAHHRANYRQLERRTKEYAALLQDEQDEIVSMAGILSRQLDKLLDL